MLGADVGVKLVDADQPAPTDPAALVFLTMTTQPTFHAELKPGEGANTAVSMARWINTRGEEDPQSQIRYLAQPLAPALANASVHPGHSLSSSGPRPGGGFLPPRSPTGDPARLWLRSGPSTTGGTSGHPRPTGGVV